MTRCFGRRCATPIAAPPRKVTYFEPVAPRLGRNTIIESTFEVGRRFRCPMRIDCGQFDPGAVIRPEPGEWRACPRAAAYVAGLARGLYPEPQALVDGWRPERRFTAQMPAAERGERYTGWRRAVTGVLATVS